jgi:Fe-S cluster assembly protein SufD
MKDVMKNTNPYHYSFVEFEKRLAAGKHRWLNGMRMDALSSFSRLGFPAPKDEEWRFTDISALSQIPFKPAAKCTKCPAAAEVARHSIGDENAIQLVFVNGFYCEELSTLKKLPKGVLVGNLAVALDADRAQIEPFLAKLASYRHSAFAALNTAFMSDGAFVYIPPATAVNELIHILYLSAGQPEATISYPRSLIVLGSGSQANIVESYAGVDRGIYFTNAVTEVFVGNSSLLDHYKLQRESEAAYHIATIQVQQERDSSFTSHSISLGGSLVRNDLNVLMNATGAECVLNGLYAARGRQHVDNHTSIDHAQPHCSSRELYKGILDDGSSGVFNGRILVRKDAQKTNARQTNKNLLLSKDALINTQPQLEIFADDVKCTHGAAIGQLNEEELFYLRSRGIGKESARTLLTYAFASDLLNAIKIKPIQCEIDLLLLARLSRTRERAPETAA